MTTTKGQIVAYIRVSALDQNPDRQTEQLSAFNIDETFIEHVSGKDRDRPQLTAAIKHLRKGDTLIVSSIDRLARNLDDLRRTVYGLTQRGVAVQFVKESLTFTGEDTPIARLLLSMLGAVAEFERSLIHERQLEGVAIAKTKGVYKGRKQAMSDEAIAELIAKDQANGHKNRTALAKESGISRETLYQYLKTATV